MLALRLWLLPCWIACCLGDTSDSIASLDEYENAFIAQRDISAIIPVDQLTSFGISINTIILDKVGYSNESIAYIAQFLDLKTSMFILDLYWNDVTQKWQLCPAFFPSNVTSDMSQTVNIPWNGRAVACQPSFTVTEFLNSFRSYLSRTNVRAEANVIQLAFNLKSITPFHFNTSSYNSSDSKPSLNSNTRYKNAFRAIGNATLQDSLDPLSDYLFSPSDYEQVGSSLSQDSSQQFYFSSFPTQYELMYRLYKRVVPFVLNNELSNSSSYRLTSQDYDLLYFPEHKGFYPFVASVGNQTLEDDIARIFSHSSSSKTFGSIVNESQFRLAIDSDETSFTNESIGNYLKSGFTTILNSSHYQDTDEDESDSATGSINHILTQFVPVSLWSWAPREPVAYTRNETLTGSIKNESWYVSSSSQSAYRCVTVGQTGWALSNCYDKMRWACKNNSNPFSWEVSHSMTTFFQFSDAHCPSGFSVGVPRSSIEQFSLLSLLRSKEISVPIWIDMNDITVSECFVSGGPYALCPYKEVVTTRSFIKNLAPSSLVALFILFLVFCEKFSTTPIHTNRKRHWKKTITNFYKENDYEGEPL